MSIEVYHIGELQYKSSIKVNQIFPNLQSTWLEESAKAGYFQPEENYWINDLGGTFKCNIPAVVKSPIRKMLFENRVFFITPSVLPGPS